MEELDLLKKDWQKNDIFVPISELEIYKMLHKKSSSVVKWILGISILELLIFRGLDFFILIFDKEDIAVLKEIGLYSFEKWLTGINILILLIFIYLLYKNYKKINNDSSTKQLMEDIIKTRKVVQYYVNYNLIMLVCSFIYTLYMVVFNSQELSFVKNSILNNQKNMAITIGVLLVLTAIIFGFFWLFYKLLYGILLKKLNRNYIELQKIDI